MELPVFLRGIIVGFSIAAPVGPIGILCIRRTITRGRIAGLVSGLGAATADSIYGSLAAMGLSVITHFLIDKQTWLRFIGGAFLCYLGIKFFFETPDENDSEASLVDRRVQHTNGLNKSHFTDYTSTLLLTLTNPLTILSFTAIFAGIGITQIDDARFQGLLLVSGVFLGSAVWWVLLSSLASVFRKSLLVRKYLIWINRTSGVIILAFGVLALSAAFAALTNSSILEATSTSAAVETTFDANGYKRVLEPLPLVFPEDHGEHPDYLTEWWYFTGNLTSEDRGDFGYQLTFFRRSLVPPGQTVNRASDWAATQAYMAHFAISDIQGERHHSFEILSRGAAGLAGAEIKPFRVWLYHWEVTQLSPNVYSLRAGENGLQINLTLEEIKSVILHGDQGYSQKSVQPGQASIYYSLTRLKTEGFLSIDDQIYQVSGFSWMDHEFSTSALSADQVGWDWFSFQLNDGSELMLFQIRRQDGNIDPFSSGTIVYPDGTTRYLSYDEFTVQSQKSWKSLRSHAEYPSDWLIRILPGSYELRVEPCLSDQELFFRYVYWEGCVGIKGVGNGVDILGKGYVELTGYAGSMAGEF